MSPAPHQDTRPARRFTMADVLDAERDPTRVPIRHVKLTPPQERLLAECADRIDARPPGVSLLGPQIKTAEGLTDWGMVTQGQRARGGLPCAQVTDRGLSWLRHFRRDAPPPSQ